VLVQDVSVAIDALVDGETGLDGTFRLGFSSPGGFTEAIQFELAITEPPLLVIRELNDYIDVVVVPAPSENGVYSATYSGSTSNGNEISHVWTITFDSILGDVADLVLQSSGLRGFVSSTTTTIATGFRGNDGLVICENALVAVDYVIHTDPSTLLVSSVTAEILVSNVTVPNLVQRFGSRFVVDGQTSRVLPLSGNPGYNRGQPLLYGTLASRSQGQLLQTAISRDVLGLQVIGGDSQGNCFANPSNVLEQSFFSTTVNFGEDLQSTCALHFTSTELMEFCLQREVVPELNVSDGYVGVFGNSLPENIHTWIPIDTDGLSDGASARDQNWVGERLTCFGSISSLHYEFLYTEVGNKESPQNKIVSARAFYSNEDWVFRKTSSSNEQRQTFLLHTTVSFIKFDAESFDYIPPAPPLMISVPYDVFYPFNSPASSRQPANWAIFVVLLAGALVVQ